MSAVRADPKKRLWRDQLAIGIKQAGYAVTSKASRARHLIKEDRHHDTAYRVELVFFMPTKDKRRHGLPHTSRPDTDNLTKFVLDVLEDSGVLSGGDAKAASLSVRKVWCPVGKGGVQIAVWRESLSDKIPGTRRRWTDDSDDGIPGWLAG